MEKIKEYNNSKFPHPILPVHIAPDRLYSRPSLIVLTPQTNCIATTDKLYNKPRQTVA